MNASLQRYPLSPALRDDVFRKLWKCCHPDLLQELDVFSYFEYYSTQCQRFSRDGGIHLCITTHAEIIDIAGMALKDMTRDDIRAVLVGRKLVNGISNDLRAVDTTIDLCASLLMMTDVGMHKFGFSRSSPLPWADHQTLRQAAGQHFPTEKKLLSDNPRFGKIFTARNLSHIGGIKIRWTNNLVDHLRLTDDDQTLFVFHCASFLKHHRSFAEQIFPEGFVEETLSTLALLFPQNDERASRWIRSQISRPEQGIDPKLAKCGSLTAKQRRFENFYFWHDRLVVLKQAFDEAGPRTLSQWWNDRRNPVQWYTFWIAIWVFTITVFFGLVQSVEGALQIYLSWKALGFSVLEG